MQSHSEFEEFAIAATPSLLRSAYLLTGDQHLAEDLVQTALAKTHRYWRRINERNKAAAYTRKTMYHLQVSWWRRKRFNERFSDQTVDQPAPDTSPDIDLKLSLRAALGQLTAKQRAVIVLRYFEDHSVSETARLLGCTEGNVKTQTFRSLNKLRAVLPSLTDLMNGAV